MKKKAIQTVLFFLFFTISTHLCFSQPIDKIAYINTHELLESIPGKADAEKLINELNDKYKEELQVMENDYNKKYSDFITWQNTMAESIRLRRMQELYELEKGIKKFMEVAQKDIEEQEKYLLEPLLLKLKEAVEEVGEEQGFICIYDVSSPSIAFVTSLATDANPLVRKKLLEK